MTEGLKRARFRVIGAVEIDPVAVESFRKNHPNTRVWKTDIRTLARRPFGGAWAFEGAAWTSSRVALLARVSHACAPRMESGAPAILVMTCCSSSFGSSRNFSLDRSCWKNVPGLARNYRFREFVRRLRELGYHLDYEVLNAADYGVPQRRRLILLAARRRRVPFAPISDEGPTVRDAFEGLARAGRSGDPLHDFPEDRSKKVSDLIRQIPRNGGSRRDLGNRKQLRCHRTFDGFKDVYGRMAWNEVAPTITSGCVNPSKGRFLHPSCNRAITLQEAAFAYVARWSDGATELIRDTAERVIGCSKQILEGLEASNYEQEGSKVSDSNAMRNEIVSARITDLPKQIGDPLPEVWATFQDGTDRMLFSYYPDEISFQAQDFIGLTEEEASLFKFGRDRAYLQAE